MIPVREIVHDDVIQDLWGGGYTIIARRMLHPDPFHVPPQLVPHGRSYQWWHLIHDKFHFECSPGKSTGWAPVPASRHDGLFMPAGHVGDIEVNGLGLFEKSKVEVDQEHAKQIAAAQKPLQDWGDRVREIGFTGGVRVVDQGGNITSIAMDAPGEVLERKDAKTIETTVAIPPDMMPHMSAIFAERDRLEVEVVLKDRTLKPGEIADKFFAAIQSDQGALWWPTLRAILLPIAVENVRKTMKDTDHE